MAVLPIIASSLVVMISLIILCILHVLPTGGSAALSFSVKLIHRDNPESPAYDPTSTPLSRIRAAIQRSVALANYFRNTSASANSNSRRLTAVDGESFFLDGMTYHGTFLIELRIGNQHGGIRPQFAYLGISTEEDMSFVMCKTNENNDKKDAMFFDPSVSTTYSAVPCLSDSCNSIRPFPCGRADENQVCKYEDRPFGRSIIISGTLSTETVHLRNPIGGWVGVHGIHFGCTHKIKILPGDVTLDRNRRGIGILGLNNHHLSFLSQLHLATNGKLPPRLSNCLSLNKKKASQMYFGELPPYKKGSHTTPLFVSVFGNRYYLQLKKIGIYFEGKIPEYISVNQEKGSDRGNMLLDSSWPITHITRRESMFLSEHAIEGMHRQRVNPPPGLHPAIEICYDWDSPDPRELPIVEFTFKNGATMSTRNLFSVVDKKVICLLLASARFTLGVRVLGIGPQLAHRISVDLEKNELNMYRNNCDS